MKYIRTKDGIYECEKVDIVILTKLYEDSEISKEYNKGLNVGDLVINGNEKVIKQADTIEELCDFAYALWNDNTFETYDLSYDTIIKKDLFNYLKSGDVKEVYFGIKTDKGLIYVAKMNDKGELEFL